MNDSSDNDSGIEETISPQERWSLLARCVTAFQPATLPPLQEAMERARAAGGVPFEVIAGAPCRRYGARVTLRSVAGAEERVASALGIHQHPWGAPDWVGIRVHADGTLHCKPYHHHARLKRSFKLPAGAPDMLDPVMAALDGDVLEVYLRRVTASDWRTFAETCVAPLGVPLPVFAPYPRPVAKSFCVSFRWRRDSVEATSLFADDRSLPVDTVIRAEWTTEMHDEDVTAYESALAGVRAVGPRPFRGWHAMLAWTVQADGTWHRATSLRVPPLSSIPR